MTKRVRVLWASDRAPHRSGDVVDLDDVTAGGMVQAGHAEFVHRNTRLRSARPVTVEAPAEGVETATDRSAWMAERAVTRRGPPAPSGRSG